jgi:hypothetical protein
MTKESNSKARCPFCSSTEIDYGSLVTTEAFAAGAFPGGLDILLKSSNKKTKKVWVRVGTCLNCGHMELFIDPKQLKG